MKQYAALWLLLGGACTFETSGTNDFGPEVAETSAGSTSAAATGDDTTGSPESSSGQATSGGSTSGVDGTTTAADTDADTDANSSSTTGPACGDGVTDDNEECDDGNDDDFDECTSTCTIPVCDDGVRNGTESDVDCGGTCQACALCLGCSSADDCEGDMACSDDGQCIIHQEMVIDWVDDCGGQDQGVTIPDLPAGTYLATAHSSAGTLWLPPHTPPTTGYFFETWCAGMSFDEMRTPAGQRYADIAASFDAMISETETFEYLGGDFTCWADDGNCGDNNGTVEFSIQYVCER